MSQTPCEARSRSRHQAPDALVLLQVYSQLAFWRLSLMALSPAVEGAAISIILRPVTPEEFVLRRRFP
jgi:hypothetical protein